MKWLLLALPLLFAACDSGHDHADHDHAGHDHDGKQAVPSDKVKDPVCKMEVSKATAKKVEFDKADVYLCTDECVAKFKADPSKFVQACTCAKTMKNCDCGHCGGKRELCDCGHEKK